MQEWLDKQIEEIRSETDKKIFELERDFQERMHTVDPYENEEQCRVCPNFSLPCDVYPCKQCIHGEAETQFSWWKKDKAQ